MKTATIIAIQDRVIVIPDEVQDKSPGGIILPDNAQEKPRTGEVLTMGPGRSDTTALAPSMSVQTGDKVYFGRYAGAEIEFAGQKLIVLREDDILAVVR